MNHTATCPACFGERTEVFYRLPSVPSNSCILLESREEAANYPRGRIDLGFCHDCGFISNLAFDPKLTEYSERYEETQTFSETFNKFHLALVERLIDEYDLRGKRILEIGCGKGEFLQMLCELGESEGIGFDPGFQSGRLQTDTEQRARFVKDFYSEKYADEKADFVCSKMTLEHISDTGDFIGRVRRAIGDYESEVFFQIPEATRILRDCAFEDIYYEHCSYFTPGSLARLFRDNDFEVIKLNIEYGEQYLSIAAKPKCSGVNGKPIEGEDDLEALRALVSEFPNRVDKKLVYWRDILESAKSAGQKVALWGSGSKAASFLTSLDVTDEIDHVVDINPHRSGYFMPGTGHPIVGPSRLAQLRPDVVIVMNPVYREEITADLNVLGLEPTLLTL